MKRRSPAGKAFRMLPALAAVSGACGMAATPASALELGPMTIESVLGQPLRASIPYTLNAHEQLFDFCIFLRPGVLTEGVPTISRPKITVGDGSILLVGETPILEPVLAMQVAVDCPYTAHLARDYTLMLNPATAAPLETAQPATVANETASAIPAAQISAAPQSAAPEPEPVASASKPTPTLPIAPVADERDVPPISPGQLSDDPIQAGSRYFVQAGDSVSSIARRIENRPVGLWPAVNAIHADNLHAFVDGDPNQLNAAVWLDIPDFGAAYLADDSAYEIPQGISETPENEPEVAVSEQSNYQEFAPVESEPVETVSYASEPIAAAALPEEAVADEPEPVEDVQPLTTSAAEITSEPAQENAETALETADTTEFQVEEPAVAAVEEAAPEAEAPVIVDDTDVLRPGDILPETETAAATAPVAQRDIPVVSSATTTSTDDGGIPKWMMLAAGSVLALILAFFAFGRTLRERFAPGGEPEPMLPDAVFDDEPTTEAKIVDDVDFQFDENTLNSQSISLDADLVEGTGLKDSVDLDVAQDFGFSATATGDGSAEIDLELPPEAAVEPVDMPTDIIEPSHREEDALVATITPAAEDTQSTTGIEPGEDYDLSMIVDATKQELGNDELTAKDLHAIPVEDTPVSQDNPPVPQDIDNQTLNSEVDIAILEQDYQDEFTQTQALNDEIARAAEELALRMQEEDTAEVTSQLESVEDPAMLATMDATQLALNDDDPTMLGDLEDTGVNPQLTANMQNPGSEPTVEMPPPGAEKTVEMPPPGSDPTVEMPHPGSEPTVEMANPGNDPTVEVEAGKADDKEPKAS